MRWDSVDGGDTLVSPAVEVEEEAPLVTTLLFRVGGQDHAIRLDEVDAVARSNEIRRVPQPLPFVVGVMDRKDEPVPVIDLAAVLELEATVTRHVILHNGPWGVVGFLVEEAAGVGQATIRDLPRQLRRAGGALAGLADIGKDTAFLIDLAAAVPEEMRHTAPIASESFT